MRGIMRQKFEKYWLMLVSVICLAVSVAGTIINVCR